MATTSNYGYHIIDKMSETISPDRINENFEAVDEDLKAVDDKFASHVAKSGGTMTGDLILNGIPSSSLGAITKGYVDGKIKIGVYVGDGISSGKVVNLGFPIAGILICGQKMDLCCPGTRVGSWNFGMALKGYNLSVLQSYSMSDGSHKADDVIVISGNTVTVKNGGGLKLNKLNDVYMYIAFKE